MRPSWRWTTCHRGGSFPTHGPPSRKPSRTPTSTSSAWRRRWSGMPNQQGGLSPERARAGTISSMSDQHLSQIATQWTMLFAAHKGPDDEAAQARRDLMLRYCGAVYRYLAKVVRDPHLAEE